MNRTRFEIPLLGLVFDEGALLKVLKGLVGDGVRGMIASRASEVGLSVQVGEVLFDPLAKRTFWRGKYSAVSAVYEELARVDAVSEDEKIANGSLATCYLFAIGSGMLAHDEIAEPLLHVLRLARGQAGEARSQFMAFMLWLSDRLGGRSDATAAWMALSAATLLMLDASRRMAIDLGLESRLPEATQLGAGEKKQWRWEMEEICGGPNAVEEVGRLVGAKLRGGAG